MHPHFSTVARCGRAWIALAALVGLCAAGAVRAALSIPAHMPATPMPDIKGCSNAQEVFLRAAWRGAHWFTWWADRVHELFRWPSVASGLRTPLTQIQKGCAP